MRAPPPWCPPARLGLGPRSISEPRQPVNFGADALDRRNCPFEQARMMRAGDVGHGYARDRRIEVEEGFVRDHGGNLRAEAAGAQILVDDQAAASPSDAVEDHVAV